jgi:phage baseplate assembly protein W
MLFTNSIKYPITFNLTSGETDLDSRILSINRCIGLCLTSAKYELFGDPDFGSRLYEMLFSQYSEDFENAVKKEIVECLTAYESRVTFRESDITIEHVDNADRNKFKITLSYSIKGTNKMSETSVFIEEDIANG